MIMQSLRTRRHGALVLILSSVVLAATAPCVSAAARVDAIELPAWVERDGGRLPARPGLSLEVGDRVHTGIGGRARLRVDEGSFVKLGENADFLIREGATEPASGAFRGFLDVLKGAFRFTTTALSRTRRRNVTIRISGITAGIRGTDLWGKAAPDRDIVCLIEGNISVRRGEEPEFTMDQPLSFYIAPRNAPALPVAPVDPDQLRQWAEETETDDPRGVLREDGRWQVNLAAYRDHSAADAAVARFADQGYPAAVTEVEVNGEPWLRVAVAGYTTLEGARAAASRLEALDGVNGAWVTRR